MQTITTITRNSVSSAMGCALAGVKLMLRAAFAALAVVLCFQALRAIPLQGAWLDHALSDSLSRKYDLRIGVKHTKITRLFNIQFESLKVDSKQGSPLIRAASGTLRLKKFGWTGGPRLELKMSLNNADFFRDYYKNSKAFENPLSGFVRKPLSVKSLDLLLVQRTAGLELRILDSVSPDVRLSGGLVVERTGQVHDRIAASFSTGMLLRAIL